jgi:prevent-host-death family protein
MTVVGTFEAKNNLGHLLDLVEQGEEVTITRHGKDVARLVPARARPRRDEAQAAIRRIRKRAKALKLGPFDWPSGRPLATQPSNSPIVSS